MAKSDAWLTDPGKVADRLAGGGWRQYVFTPQAALFDALAATPDDELDAAIAAAKTGPDGWAFRLRRWADERQVCLRSATGPRGEYCQLEAYSSAVAAAIAYMCIDIDRLKWAADTRQWERRRADEEEEAARRQADPNGPRFQAIRYSAKRWTVRDTSTGKNLAAHTTRSAAAADAAARNGEPPPPRQMHDLNANKPDGSPKTADELFAELKA